MLTRQLTGVQTRLQHVKPADTQKEPQLPSLGLQLQSEAREDAHHQGEKEE